MVPKRTSKGKQKLEMKKIEKKKSVYASFSKRKLNIYKKCSDLSTLCGASVDVLMFSPSGKPYCYGNPSSESITRTSLDNDQNSSIEEFLKNLAIGEYNTKNDKLVDEINVAEARREELKKLTSSGWWSINEENVDDYNNDELIRMEKQFVDFSNIMINNVLSNSQDIDNHAKSTINELNRVDSSPTYVIPLNEANLDGASRSGMKNLCQEDNVNSGGSGSQAQALPNNDENDN